MIASESTPATDQAGTAVRMARRSDRSIAREHTRMAEPSAAGAETFGPSKIQPHHRQRLAVVYVRQSSPHQVMEHRESAALQYNLKRRAIEWGWPAERVLVIDQDQGRTGTTVEGRLGFQQLLAEVSLDHVGLILGIEMSRLARSNKDWHQLLELCALFSTLLADHDGLYDPRAYNDRLLLGLKGTLSEAELHLIRQRMEQGRMNKARRGELFTHPPVGYVHGPSGERLMDPDEQVQSVIRLIFRKFEELGSVNAVLLYLLNHDIRLGFRPHDGPNHGQVQWRRVNRATLTGILTRPTYAGAYAWGRRLIGRRGKSMEHSATGRTVVGRWEYDVLIKDHGPAYITWEQYKANIQQIVNNRTHPDALGSVREGPALLKGLLACGVCGYRMRVSYSRDNLPRYVCMRAHGDYGEPLCQSLAGRNLDALITKQVLRVLEPASLDLSLSASADIQRERAELEQHWRQRLERAAYERDRACRQYQAVEPENRLVARELERRWERALLAERALQEAYDRHKQEQPADLTEADRELIQALAHDIPRLWHAPDTASADRQTAVRQLIERVVVTPHSTTEVVDVTIQFAGGFVSRHELRRAVARYEQLRDYAQLMDRIAELTQKRRTASQIAQQLNH